MSRLPVRSATTWSAVRPGSPLAAAARPTAAASRCMEKLVSAVNHPLPVRASRPMATGTWQSNPAAVQANSRADSMHPK
jgi:hypothetical protein